MKRVPHAREVDQAIRGVRAAVKEALKVIPQLPFVLGRGHSIHAHRSVLAGASVRFFEPVDVHQIGQRCERHLRRLFRQLRYPLLFRGHDYRISRHSSCFSKTVP